MDKIYLVPREMIPQKIGFLDEELVHKLHMGDALMIASYNEEVKVSEGEKYVRFPNINGLAIFRITDETHQVELCYINYYGEDKKTNISNLYHEAEEILKKLGVKRVSRFLVGSKEEIKGDVEFLFDEGFVPIVYDWHLLGIDREEILNNPKLKPFLNCDKTRFRYNTETILRIATKSTGKNFAKLISVCSIRDSRFYIKDNRIMAAVLVSKPRDGVINIYKIYMNKEVEEKWIIIQLLVQALRYANQTVNTIDIAITNKETEDIIRYLFETEDTNIYYQRYDRFI